MVNQKQLFTLDEDCLDILKDQPEKKKSDFVRKSIKYYNANKDRTIEEPKLMSNIQVEL